MTFARVGVHEQRDNHVQRMWSRQASMSIS